MALPNLPLSFACECGHTHTCDIRRVVCGALALAEIPSLLTGFAAVTLVTDRNTWRAGGRRVYEALRAAGLRVTRAHYDTEAVLVPNEESIAFLTARAESAEVLVGVGSGVINDLCKYVAFQKDIPYLIAASAPSMDGFASSGAAMILRGMKVTVPARPPRWIVGDTDILREAPLPMLQSGIGDILGKYSCLNDWKLAHIITGEAFCPRIYDMVLAEARDVRENIEGVLARRADSVGRLFEGLVLVGIAMSLAGNSRPASGSEHHLSHFYEVVGLLRGAPYLPHGIDVAYASLVTCRLRERLRREGPGNAVSLFDKAAWQTRMNEVYGSMAGEVIALQEKTGFYAADRSGVIRAHFDEIATVLAEAPTGAEMAELLHRAGLSERQYLDTYGRKTIEDSVRYARDLKDRYTLLWVLGDLGLLDDYAAETGRFFFPA